MRLRTRNRLLVTAGSLSFIAMLLVVPPFSLIAIIVGVVVMVFSVGQEGRDDRERWPTNKASMALGVVGFTGGLVMLSLTVYRP